ncbi:MAG: hydantoinase/oxoprolinase, partial [Desulfobacteraceae bacterium]|nr:hydantoinase/oxoprolinase [Desulfobacteraceae bacterium]
RMSALHGEIVGVETGRMVENLWEEIVRKLALVLLKNQLGGDTDTLDRCAGCRRLMGSIMEGGNRNFGLRVNMRLPFIGIGAPVHHFLPRAAALLGAEVVLPDHADVAGAIGAVMSRIEVRRQLKIQPGDRGGFMLEGLAGARHFTDFERASESAEGALVDMVRETARAFGTSEEAVEVDFEDHIVPLGDGTQLFLGRTLTGRLVGEPDLVLARAG